MADFVREFSDKMKQYPLSTDLIELPTEKNYRFETVGFAKGTKFIELKLLGQ